MLSFVEDLPLLRYLLVLKIRTRLVLLNSNFTIEFSAGLGSIMAKRMFTSQARAWQKKLALFSPRLFEAKKKNSKEPFPETFWPVEAVIWPPPIKIRHSRDDLLLCELKLFGNAADHSWFLETILPALEQASMESAPPLTYQSHLWGNFDLEAVYVAHGASWKPVVESGRLDFRVRPKATQWSKLPRNAGSACKYNTLNWLTPIIFSGGPVAPQLVGIIEALFLRLSELTGKSYHTFRQYIDNLSTSEIKDIQKVVLIATQAELIRQKDSPTTINIPGAWQGLQIYKGIPKELLPYLELASILHVGSHTHFGCGTFYLS